MRRCRHQTLESQARPSMMAAAPRSMASHSQCEDLSSSLDNAPSAMWTRPSVPHRPLYTPDQRRRRDATRWTTVQGILAPLQFAVFLVSLVLVLRFLLTGEGYAMATASVVAKTALLYAIMVTGSLWERAVFGRFLFAPAFFWEDAVSMAVIALHTAYLYVLLAGTFDPRAQMFLALAAYATYVVNAIQFILKLRAARREADPASFVSPEVTPLARGVAS